MCEQTASALDIETADVLVCSTGVIGVKLPMAAIGSGIPRSVEALSDDGGQQAAAAIMTTDTFAKSFGVELELAGISVRIGGMAKGAGMINPNMATMLCYVCTDAVLSRLALQRILDQTLPDSFNAISVDGDTSTNDTLVLLANGLAGNREITGQGKDYTTVRDATHEVLCDLARMCVKDGEGATKVVDVFVHRAKNDADAEKVARTVACSSLVKTAFFGGDPNWGRIACAVGYAGARVDQTRLAIFVGEVPIGQNGMNTGARNEKRAATLMKKPEFSITIDLGLGRGTAHLVTSDLSTAYVHFNSAYTT